MRAIYYKAAGGIVVRAGWVLVLHKHAKDEYVLPKGHVEEGETLEQTALRETAEETGYANLRILTELGTLRSEYPLDGRQVTRDETYYLMELMNDEHAGDQTHPEAEHDRRTFRQLWLPVHEAAPRLTYQPARTAMSRASAWLRAYARSDPHAASH